ncbi:hypothetical protein, partial [Ralstonia pseudosolanacearum]|uniref:hypothetical protein n=2 Tax=Ralstonia pseudosolanacearum TaxID=1310165 RepID=UPI001E2FAE5F
MKTGSVSSGYTGYAYSSDEETSSYNAESFQSSSPGRRASEWLSQLSLSPPRAHNLPPRIRETLINGVREWNREPSCSRFPHRGKEVPIEHVFRRFRVVPGA